MERAPTWATTLGDHRYDDRVGDRSVRGAELDDLMLASLLAEARALDASTMSPRDQMLLELFTGQLEVDVAAAACRWVDWSFSPRNNVLVDANGMVELHPLDDAAGGETLLTRLEGWAASVDEHIAALKQGVEAGRVAQQLSVQLVLDMVDQELDRPVAGWAMARIPPELGWEDAAAAKVFPARLEAVLEGVARPALTRWRATLAEVILPAARSEDAPGLSTLPGGEACYPALIRRYTTLPLGAEEVHATGIEELKGIHAEMRTLGSGLFGTEDLGEIFERLRTDPSLYFGTSEEVVETAERALGDAQAAAPEWFGTLSDTECVVQEIPDYEAPYTTIAYYRQPIPDRDKPGEYFVNSYLPESRPRYEAEVLAFHESVPGHHLQIALSYDLPDTPAFHRFDGYTVFVEGWALYTERLADEMGLYSGDLDRMGMLSFDSWRAARLAVDTGLHDRGWSREQAVQFMLENTPLAENNIRNEVDRYVTWPGQALAYKTGQLEMWRLRREAEASLGDRFDIKRFHDTVLGTGAVSLPVLRDVVARWVEAGGT